MNTRKIMLFVFSGLLLMSVLITACSTPSALAQNTQTGEIKRTISVNGNGQVTITPDIAYVSIGVRTETDDPGESVSENNAQAQRVIDALIREGVSNDDISTSNFNLFSNEQFDIQGRPTGTKYIVENTVRVTVRDLDGIGDLLTTAIEAGANNIFGIQFDVSDKTSVLSEARELAVENARSQAEQLAQLNGVELGEVQTVSSFGGGFPPPIIGGKGGGAAAAESFAVPISPGQFTVSVDVSIVYEIQ